MKLTLALLALCLSGCVSLATVKDGTGSDIWSLNPAVSITSVGASGESTTTVVMPSGPFDDTDFKYRDLEAPGQEITANNRTGEGKQAAMWSGMLGGILGFLGGIFAAPVVAP